MVTPSPIYRSDLRVASLTQESDICRVIALETSSYPPDEAATESTIRFRQKNANVFFWAAYLPKGRDFTEKLVGFVNDTLTAGTQFDGESMTRHDPCGSVLCIHSVVIDPAFRRQGLLLTFCGFTVTKLSSVVHGKDPWFELQFGIEARIPQIIHVDAFTYEVFQGNPAAVVLLLPSDYHKEEASEWMQRVAIETNVGKTAFVARREHSKVDNIAEYDLRWFTPGGEVDPCGHAILSTAIALLDTECIMTRQTLHFHTGKGVLMCGFYSQEYPPKLLVGMEFPAQRVDPIGASVTLNDMASALGLDACDVIDLKRTASDVLVRVSCESLAKVKPNLAQLTKIQCRGVIVTAVMRKGNIFGLDIQSRYFAPRMGVNEDPVTVSIHCALGRYWASHLQKSIITAHQFTPIRGGYLTLDVTSE